MPMIPINYLAVLACGIVSVILGFVWYGPLFGKVWMQLTGTTAEDVARFKANPAMMRKMNMSYALTALAALVTAFVLAHAVIFAEAYLHIGGIQAGLLVGFMGWLGFVAPVTLNSVLWDRKPWKYWFLVNGYSLIQLLVMGVILALWM